MGAVNNMNMHACREYGLPFLWDRMYLLLFFNDNCSAQNGLVDSMSLTRSPFGGEVVNCLNRRQNSQRTLCAFKRTHSL